ncbi:MAG: glycosyltransferase [Clostridia bacterium]|nr:glycosyltransferase [Clostridia bacterium]
MEILFIIPTNGGGAEKVSITYANILYEYNVDINILFISDKESTVCGFLNPHISTSYINDSNKIRRYIKIWKFLKLHNPKVVFSSIHALTSLAILYKFFCKDVKVVTRQCFMPGRFGGLMEGSIKLLYPFANKNIAQTNEMRDAMIRCYNLNPQRVVVINNPVDETDIEKKISGIKRPSCNQWRFIAVGRIAPVKDYVTLIRAFYNVWLKYKCATLTIVGQSYDVPYRELLDKLIDELGIGDNIQFIPYTSNPYIYLIESNCFVLTSLTEGLPNSLVEALYLNLPCVATECIPFIKYNIINKVNGYTAPIGDVEKIAEAMINASSLYGKISNSNRNSDIKKLIINTFKQSS